MKIGINLVGLSYHTLNGEHSYESGYENLFKNVIDPLKKEHDVDLYLYTYHSTEEENIIKIYNPKKHTFKEISPALETYIKSLEELENEDLDFIIVTRFDLDLRVPISFNFSKFNFLFKEKEYWKDYNLTTDTLYAFPKHMLQDLISAIHKTYNNPKNFFCPKLFHCLHNYLIESINESDFHYIDEELTTVAISDKFRLGKFKHKNYAK